ncbi:hypothetical protein AAHA92_05743 [Salvia divinorum]|uniref:Uncharacterized protein n=1 Tax=Salvia divinorum TaxID=28513 RepID=A0ABD1I3G5_SALDI
MNIRHTKDFQFWTINLFKDLLNGKWTIVQQQNLLIWIGARYIVSCSCGEYDVERVSVPLTILNHATRIVFCQGKDDMHILC